MSSYTLYPKDPFHINLSERPDEYGVSVQHLCTEEGAVVRLKVFEKTFIGVAKTHPDDMPGNPRIGRDLALFRAFKEAARFHRDRAFDAMSDHVRRVNDLRSRDNDLA